MDTEICIAEDCSRLVGHPMPHGHEISPGLVIAPWSDMPRVKKDSKDDPAIPCNSCGVPLILDPEQARASCSFCGQRISFDEQGHTTETIIPKIYPSKMTDPKMLREFADYKVEQWEFFDTLKLRFGFITEEQFAESRLKGEQAKKEFIEKEVLPLENKPRWKFWRR